MNASSIASLPAFAGSSVLTVLGRLARWSWQQYFSAPLQNAALGLLGLAIVLSASNALFWQTGLHPAPLFSQQTEAVISPHEESSVPVVPMPRVLRQQPVSEPGPEPVQQTAPGPVSTQSELPHVAGNVSNQQLARAQEILKALGLFDGKVDGFYGPQTAEGLRAFELRNGLTPKGALTPEIIQKILDSPATRQPSAQTVIVQTPPAPVVAAPSQTPPRSQLAQQANADASANAPLPPVLTQQQAVADPLSAITQSVAARQSTSVAPQPAPAEPVVDAQLIRKIQRGLASLGFLAGSIDGIAGEATARAIRNFEVYNNYEVTGEVSAEMLDLLLQGGAAI